MHFTQFIEVKKLLVKKHSVALLMIYIAQSHPKSDYFLPSAQSGTNTSKEAAD